MKNSHLLSLLLIVATTGVASAQTYGAPPPPPPPAPVAESPGGFGVHGAVALPIGDASDVLDIAFGVIGSYNYPVMPQLDVTGRAGFLYQTGNGDLTVVHVPLLAGVEYKLGANPAAYPYLAAELGLIYLRASVGDFSDSETELGSTLGAGYRMGQINARAQLYIASLDETDDSLHIMATVGYHF